MNKNINYKPNRDYFSGLVPSKNCVPEWYRKAERYDGGKLEVAPVNTKTFKTCVPFLDAITSGYIIKLPVDVMFETSEDGSVRTSWITDDYVPVRIRDNYGDNSVPTPSGNDAMMSWDLPVCFKLPADYSALITHPFNRFDLPFVTTSGVVDGGWTLYGGQIPFFLNKGFSGIVEAGTPIIQVLPFKRDAWSASLDDSLDKEAFKNYNLSRTKIVNWYKSTMWKRKDYS
jgi:hypothetical protein